MNSLSNIQKSMIIMALSLLAVSAMAGSLRGFYRFNSCMNGYLFYALKLSQFVAAGFFIISLLLLVYFVVMRLRN